MASLCNLSCGALLNIDHTLPDGYRQVEYIEKLYSGAYINTNVVASIDLETTIIASTTTGGYLFGVTPAQSIHYYGINLLNTKKLEAYFGSRNAYNTIKYSPIDLDGSIHTYIAGIKFYYDGSLAADYTNAPGNTFDSQATINLFTISGGYLNINSAKTEIKMYSCEMKIGNTYIRNYIPCINPNNVAGMYDLVGKQFYSSPNGVAFVAGPEV